MNIRRVKNYNGSFERIIYIVNEIAKELPEVNNFELICDGGRAWGKGIYISDCLFYVKIHFLSVSYDYDQINGLRVVRGEEEKFKILLQQAKNAVNGEYNHFTIEQAKSFLKLNK